MTVLRVPYHLDEYLPDLELPLAPAQLGSAQTITAELPAGDPWARLAAVYRRVADAVAAAAGQRHLVQDRVVEPGHDVRGSVVDEGRHDGVLQEDALQDERLLAAEAPLGQPPPLAGRVHLRLARRDVPGVIRRPGRQRGGGPQLVHGPGPDRLVVVELAERPHVFAPA